MLSHILIYSAFLGPIVAIMLVEYYILRKQKVDTDELYMDNGIFRGYNPSALLSMVIGAGAAFLLVDIGWIIGVMTAGTAYLLLSKFAFKGSSFKKGTIYE